MGQLLPASDIGPSHMRGEGWGRQRPSWGENWYEEGSGHLGALDGDILRSQFPACGAKHSHFNNWAAQIPGLQLD